MPYFGCHLSPSGGYAAMVRTAASLGGDTFQFFTRNPRGSRAKAPDLADAARAGALMKEGAFGPVVAHGAYTMNLCTQDPDARAFAAQVLTEDLGRTALLPGCLYNFHPGSHLQKISPERSLDLIAESINIALDRTQGVTAVIENTAGQGSNLGFRFEHLAYIIDKVEDKSRVGICIDTCHAFTAGYDLRTAAACDATFSELDRIVGLKYLRGMHLNDTLKTLGSHVDRHAPLGEGVLGIECFRYIARDSRFDDMPLILETPDESRWAEEIAELKRFSEE